MTKSKKSISTLIKVLPHEYLRKKLLDEMNLTIVEIAKQLHLSTVSVSFLLNGKTNLTVSVALRIEKVFGIDAQWLMQMQWQYSFEQEYDSIKKSEVYRKLKKFDAKLKKNVV